MTFPFHIYKYIFKYTGNFRLKFFRLIFPAHVTSLSSSGCGGVQSAVIFQLSQYCTFRMDSISTVITEGGKPVASGRAVGVGGLRLHAGMRGLNSGSRAQ